jgi:AcrR family transcriptional regulator
MKNQRIKKRLSNDERRAQIIDVALSVFADKGFNGAKTRQIADKAGTSEALIFQHFKTKEDLYRTALGELLDIHSMSVDCKEAMVNKDDYGVFNTFASHVFSYYQQDPRAIRLILFSALEGSPITGAFHPKKERTSIELLTEYIQKRIKERAFKRVNAGLASQLFVEAVVMFIVDREASLTTPLVSSSDKEVVDTIVKIFVDGLRANA